MWLSWRIQHAFPHCVLPFSCLNHLLKSPLKEPFDVPPKRSHFWFSPFQWITTPSSSYSDQQREVVFDSSHFLLLHFQPDGESIGSVFSIDPHADPIPPPSLLPPWCRPPYISRELIKEPPNGWIFLPPPLTLYSPPSSQREPGESDQQLRSLLKTFQQVPSQRRSQSPPLWYVPLWSSPPARLADCVSHSSLPTVPRQGQERGPCKWLPPFLCICTPPPSGPRSAAIPDESLALPPLHFSA